jgi:ABC-type transporter Mla MlaB component
MRMNIKNRISVESTDNSDVVGKTINNLKSIHLSSNGFVIKEEAPVNTYQKYQLQQEQELPGVYFKGIQYYDLKNIYFINNAGIADLINLLKSLLEQNVEVQFVNVTTKIKDKIRSMDLDQILICI